MTVRADTTPAARAHYVTGADLGLRSTRYGYLDGLRGLSIVPVLLGHAYDAALVPRGLRVLFAADAGVRMFFVVSGFIITQLLLGERHARGRVRLMAFFGRRGAKLLPLIWAYVLAVAVIQQFVNLDCSPRQLIAAAVLGAGFLHEGTWYVGHFWSLTVEEVFYVSWAPIVAFATKRFAICAAASMLVIAGLVHVLNVAATSNHFAETFAFWPQVKVVGELDGVAIGSLAALAGRGLTDVLRERQPWVSRAVAAVAWSIVCVASLPVEQWIDVPAPLPGFIGVIRRPALEAAIACLILLAAEGHRWGRASWLENRMLVALGRASYSIYVVQQALCVPEAWRPATLTHQPPFNLVLAVVTGFAVFVLFEDPVRRALVQRFKLAR